ncbi:hypothetical protein Tb09.142.0320 [Trypanosoma brucei brucei TREU927]|uniref:Uncharacterized protein n=1 Tax=Trypanosoma brucei brucei (strain 927/4 GUTat10.1) TaxID=185431 RepID=Q38G39_TRYB2|nr:hypothetical protein Tb09.142.0320 [Trypanosoma brucei brucei TREU927]EAN76231.1 hypothetical protein Tb09.142.0320 [Trypanosoma brucei brucei TREU927]
MWCAAPRQESPTTSLVKGTGIGCMTLGSAVATEGMIFLIEAIEVCSNRKGGIIGKFFCSCAAQEVEEGTRKVEKRHNLYQVWAGSFFKGCCQQPLSTNITISNTGLRGNRNNS